METNFISELLNFGLFWKVEKLSYRPEEEAIDIYVKFCWESFKGSSSYDNEKVHDYRPYRRWRHLDILQYKCYIMAKIPRLKGSNGQVKSVDVPWADSHERHSYLFERGAIDLLKGTKNQTKTAELLRCSFRVINRIMDLSCQRGLQHRDMKSTCFERLSIDEKSFKKGHQYVSVLSDPASGCVLDVVEGRDKNACKQLITNTLTDEQRSQVKQVSMDMWRAFMSGCAEALPDAKVVHDRFHLVKYLNGAIDKVRRREVKKHDELKSSRYALLKNKQNLTQTQRIKFEAIQQANYQVAKAWQIRENFKDLFAANASEALHLFYRWTKDALDKHIKEVSKVVKMFKTHTSGVVEALIHSLSNAMAERLNGKIQEIKLAARGYRTFQNFRSAILFFHGNLDLYPLK